MSAVQLEFNIENESHSDLKLSSMQKQIDDMSASMGKVRRKLFCDLGEMKKSLSAIKEENETLKLQLKELRNEKTEWVYGQEGCLFNVREYSRAAC